MPRTLLLKFGAIGDVIMAIPAAYALHRRGHRIDWAAGSAVLPLLALYPWINPIPVDERALLAGTTVERVRSVVELWRRVGIGTRYDQIATLYYDPRYRLLGLPFRAQRRFTLSDRDRSYRLLPGRHHTDEYARLLLELPDEVRPEALAPVPPPAMPASPLPRSERPRILLAPGGAKNLLADDALRRWPAEMYVALTTLLLAHGWEVVLIGGPGDTWVQSHFHGLPVTDLIGQLPLLATLGLLHRADLLITHDTGPLHLAGLAGCALIGLFGPTDPRGRMPQRAGTLGLWGGEGFACRPCYDGHSFAPCPQNLCMRQLTPGFVFSQAQALLESIRSGQTPAPRVASPLSTVGGGTVPGIGG